MMDEIEKKETVESRRNFLKMTAVLPLAVSLGGLRSSEASAEAAQNAATNEGRRSLVPAHLPLGTDQPQRTGSAAF